MNNIVETVKKIPFYISLSCGSYRKVTGSRGGVAHVLKGFDENNYSNDYTVAYIPESRIDDFIFDIKKLYSKNH